MSTVFDVNIYSTAITVYPGKEASQLLGPLLNLFEYEDEYLEQSLTLGYIIDDDMDLLYLNRGVDIEYLRRLLVSARIIHQDPIESKPMKFDYEELISPRNEDQKDVIDFIAGLNHHSSNQSEHQIFLVKDPGFGKTYCSGVGLCLYGQKTLIIVHRDNLRSQWTKSLRDMSGLTSRYVHEITSSDEFEYICDTPDLDYEYDVYIMTHATFRAGLKRVGSFERASNFSKNLHLGFKIIDEAHLEFRDTLLMDFIFNINRNLYLTATDGRSSKEENAIFKHVFSNTKFYRKPTINPNQPSKWVNYNTITIDTHLNPNVYRYRVAGGRGMSPASYGKWCIKNDKNKTHIKVCCDIVRQTFEKNENSKVIIFMPLIELCEETADFIYKKLSHDDSFPYDIRIRTINSRNSKVENERNKQSDVIVSTTGSLSTGVDIKGITTIISCSPMVSKIQCVQTWGRIRYGGLGFTGDYYDIIDSSCLMDTIWQKSRYKVFKNLALNINHYYWTLDDSDNEESVT